MVNVENKEKIATLTISGDEFKIRVSPEEPGVSDEIKITVEYKNGDKVKGERIRITNLDSDDYIEENTNNDGIVTFTPDEESDFRSSPAGSYEIMVDNQNERIVADYCSTIKNFIVRYKVGTQNINVIDPKLPDVPTVNKQVVIEVTTTGNNPARFANVTVLGPNFNRNYQTTNNGYISFIPESVGNYDIKITDKNYVPVTKTIAVAAQAALDISFSSDPEIGKKLTIIIKADGKAVSGAQLTVTDPGNNKKSLTTGSSGEAELDLNLAGKYRITAEKSSYTASTKEFEVYKSFQITIHGSANVGDIIKVKVLDKSNSPVRDVTLRGVNCDVDKKTDGSGEAEFKITELKEYRISFEKDGFTKMEKTISVEGKLMIRLTPDKPQMNKDVTVTILSGNMEAVSNINIIKPDGTKENVKDSRYTFTPGQVGKYTVLASKENYDDVSLSFDIAYNLVELQYDVVDGNLVFKVTKNDGEPVSGAEVGVYATTDEKGIAILKFNDNYNVSVSKESYETKKGAITVPGSTDYVKIIMGILIVILIIVIILLLLRSSKTK